jgi:RNA polymerase primary sigma factor
MKIRTRGREENTFLPAESNDALAMYVREIGRKPLLEAADEVRLARQMEAGQAELRKPASIRNGRIVEAGKQAYNQFVEANLRLVVAQVRDYVNYNDCTLHFLDLCQEGNIGLLRAAEKFDWRKGYKFSTFAIWWIRQAIGRAHHEQSRLVRVPVHLSEKLCKVNRAIAHLSESGESPSPEAIAAHLELPVETVLDVQAHDWRSVSFQKPLNHAEDQTLGSLLEDPEDLADQVARSLRNERVRVVLHEVLTARERQVIQLRFGLLDDRERTLEECGKALKVTRERIRQIEVKALKKLRAALGQEREAVA